MPKVTTANTKYKAESGKDGFFSALMIVEGHLPMQSTLQQSQRDLT